jgi:hypothetical protein
MTYRRTDPGHTLGYRVAIPRRSSSGAKEVADCPGDSAHYVLSSIRAYAAQFVVGVFWDVRRARDGLPDARPPS